LTVAIADGETLEPLSKDSLYSSKDIQIGDHPPTPPPRFSEITQQWVNTLLTPIRGA
jgi:hypothetical protein